MITRQSKLILINTQFRSLIVVSEILYQFNFLLSILEALTLWYIYYRNYRFATIFYDMLSFYPLLIVIHFVQALLSILNLFSGSITWLFLFIILFNFIIQFLVFIYWWHSYRLISLRSFFERLQANPQIKIISIDQWIANPVKNNQFKYVLIRHDVDILIDRAVEMVELENKLSLPACYYIRNNAERYAFTEAIDLINLLEANELFEIGIHYESLAKAKGNINKAKSIFYEDIEVFRDYYPLRMISAHGDKYNNRRLVRENIVNLDELGLISSYDIAHDLYLGDVGGKHHFVFKGKKMRFCESIDLIEEQPNGTLVQILIHPDWWN